MLPVSCCLSATGIRFPGHPTPAGELGLPCGRLTGTSDVRTPSGFPRSTRTRCDRGGCLLYPEGGGAVPADKNPRPAPAASQRPAPVPRLQHPIGGASITRHQRRFTRFTRPVCPLPVAPGWNGSPSAFPRASHPAVVTATHVEGGTGHFEHGPGTTLPTSVGPPICESTRYVRPRVAICCLSFRVAATSATVMNSWGFLPRGHRMTDADLRPIGFCGAREDVRAVPHYTKRP